MTDSLALFWDFFFYPLLNLDSLGIFFDVICLVLIAYSVNRFVREVLACI